MSRRLRAFKRWMRNHQIDCSDVLAFKEDDQGISVQAVCDLKEGDLVATIPKQACLTIKTSVANELIEEAGLGGSLGLSLALMFERSLGEESAWYGYLQLLPERECVPLVWSMEEVDTLLMGTELHKIVKEDKTLLYEDWKECILPLISSPSSKLGATSFGVEQYLAAKSLVASRAFQIDDFHGFGMVPLADLFNHKTGAENVHFSLSFSSDSDVEDEERNNIPENNDHKASTKDVTTDSSDDDQTPLEMIIVRDVEAGFEVFNTYGSMGNAALLHRYGFTEPDNQFDIVNIDLELILQWSSSSFSKRYCRARLSIWRKLGWSGCLSQNSEYFEISSQGEPHLELLVLLYIIFLPEERYHELNCTQGSSGVYGKSRTILVNNKNGAQDNTREMLLTRSVCQALVALADIREGLYGPNSLQDDLNALRRCGIQERKLYHSLVLRVSERTILERLRIYSSRSFNKRKRKVF
ncbi:hypothetical protein H6P81_001498 [Aristolochia fimbriata]|uniref:N-lysine methyltransferase n=1 Tax=Aristolochia fimbriata TaxID=158543 RepID=A0AAV7F722_ARIFI|nr:hypothetical protein H6P81_001498 [Aristolochia fimbriata]